MASTKRHKEVGTVANHPVFHWLRQKIGSTGAVGDTFQGGGLSIATVTRQSAGLYRLTFAEPSPFYIVNVTAVVHSAALADGVIRCGLVPGSITRTNNVLQMDIRCTGVTASGNVTQIATDPTSGSELHVQIAEIFNDALRPRPDAGV